MKHASLVRSGKLLLAAAVLAVLAAGCSKTVSVPEEAAPTAVPSVSVEQPRLTRIRVPMDANDTLNPYTCQSKINQCLSSLFFDGLMQMTPEGRYEPLLAETVESDDNQVWKIRLREGLTFSDGSSLTAADVLASLRTAQKNGSYAVGLRLIGRAVQGKTPQELEITLSEPDRWFYRSLDFPILKSNSQQEEHPIGSGRYRWNQSVLERNPFCFHAKGDPMEVELVAVQSAKELRSFFLDDKIDFFYSQHPQQLNAGRGASYRTVAGNELIYLAINGWKTRLNTEERLYLESLIDRDALSSAVWKSEPTRMPFRTPPEETDAEPAAEEAATIPAARTLPEMTILVAQESSDRVQVAELLAEQLRARGCSIQVEPCSLETLKKRISIGNYDLYIGEVRIAQNMDVSSLLFTNNQLGPGTPEVSGLRPAWEWFRQGTGSSKEVENALKKTYPMIPLLFRNGFVCFSRDFCVNIVATEQDIFYNIGEWQETDAG